MRLNRLLNSNASLVFALILGLVNGLVFAFLVPPWQHYDEPNHFAYTWLIAYHSGALPRPGDSDPAMSRAVVESMVANGFYNGMLNPPDISSPDKPVQIEGYSQLDEPRLYYLIASLPMRLFNPMDVTAQLYAGRLASLFLYLLTILAAWGTARELTSTGNILRWLLPVTLALLPGFTDSMTALNNDVVAVAVFSWFIWGSIRLLRRGFSWGDLVWVLLSAALCIFTKNTALIALPLVLVVLLFTFLRGRWHWVAWALLAGGLLAGLLMSFSWSDAAFWFRSTSQSEPTRSPNPQAVLGKYVIQVNAGAEVTPPWLGPLFQPLPPQTGQELLGKPVTLGAWIWASQLIQVRTPILNQAEDAYSQYVMVGTQPTFYAMQAKLDGIHNHLWISLNPLDRPSDTGVMIYYDGVVLAEGLRPTDQAPSFSDPNGKQGNWGGRPFVNLLRNPSGGDVAPRIWSWVDDRAAQLLPDQNRPSLILASWLDWQGAGWYYKESVLSLMHTFWGKFGWGHVPLQGDKPYRLPGIFTLITIGGTFWGLWRRWRRLAWDQAAFLGLVLAGVWIPALVRGVGYVGFWHVYLPVARYAGPAIIPTALVLSLGWMEIVYLFKAVWLRLLRPFSYRREEMSARQTGNSLESINGHQGSRNIGWDWAGGIIYIIFLFGLDIFALLSIANFYGTV
jgi:hypothetical protein